MDKKALLIITIIVLSISGGATYLLNSSGDTASSREMTTQPQQRDSQKPATNNPEATTPTATEPTPASPIANSEPGVYKDYDSSVIAATAGTKLLFFHAPWCSQCRALETDIKQKGVPEGVAIIKVDYDTNQDLRKKYGVTLQTTVVRVDDQGNLVKKYVPYDEPTLDAVKRNLL